MDKDSSVTIRSREDLSQFFPGLQVHKFRAFRGNTIFHGPCPWCGGVDRFQIWLHNGVWWVKCNQGIHWINSNSQIAAIHHVVPGLKPPSESELREINRRAREQKLADQREKEQKIIAVTNSHVWERFYHNLTDAHFEWYESQGITKDLVERFMFGFNPKFSVKNWETGQYDDHEAYTFPIFRHMSINGITGWYCTNVRHRLIGAVADKYRPYIAGLGIDYFHAIRKVGDPLIITEGEKKAAVLYRYGFNAIGLFGVEAYLDDWYDELQSVSGGNIYVVFDRESDDPLYLIEKILDRNWSEDVSEKTRKQVTIWRAARKLENRLGAVPLYLPYVGKVDDLLLAGKLTPDGLTKLMLKNKDVEIV